MPFFIVEKNIAAMQVDAVVNAANPQLQQGGGVCGAIFAAAGAQRLQQACDVIGHCPVGGAVATDGFDLPARNIIHAVGPIWQGGGADEERLLRGAYTSALTLAAQKGCESVAFPLISSGIYGYPKEQALSVAVSAIGDFLGQHEMTVYLAILKRVSFPLNEGRMSALSDLLRGIGGSSLLRRLLFAAEPVAKREFVLPADLARPAPQRSETRSCEPPCAAPSQRKLAELMGQLDESFSQMLLRLIDQKGITDVETYKRANIDRKLFSKIRGNPHYSPSKATAIAFAVALELNPDETRDLLGRAGYTLSHSSRADIIVEYFIKERIYNIHEINEALFAFDEALLGA